MSESKNAKLYANIAAICFIIVAVFQLWYYITYSLDNNNFQSYFNASAKVILFYAGMAVFLLLQKKSVGLVIFATVFATNDYYSLDFWGLLTLVRNISFLILVMINVIPSLSHKANITRIMFFIPAGLYFVPCLFRWIYNGYFYDISYKWDSIVYSLLLTFSFLFTGMWLRETIVINTPVEESNQYSTFDPSAITSHTDVSTGGADELKMYKELLDSRIITQAEFDAKKKQILGL